MSVGKPSRRGAEGVMRRHESVTQEWARRRMLEDLLYKTNEVVTVVGARTDGRCYIPGCEASIISYPHAIAPFYGGTHAAVNRAGLCSIHEVVLHAGGERGAHLREWIVTFLQRYYREVDGVPPEDWEDMANGRKLSNREVTDDAAPTG